MLELQLKFMIIFICASGLGMWMISSVDTVELTAWPTAVVLSCDPLSQAFLELP